MIGLREERGPELGQMEKQARISKSEIRPFNESFADITILRPGAILRSILQEHGPCDWVVIQATIDECALIHVSTELQTSESEG